MPRVFLSYSRSELGHVRTLAQHLRTGGYDFWFDQELSGGQHWWNEVLRQIFECDVFVAVISEHSLRSNACKLELQYAVTLGKPLLPIMVEQVSPRFLTPELGQVQIVDYRTPTLDSALRLMAALRALPPAPPPPFPYPQPPQAPESYLNTFRDWVETPNLLQRSDQIQLLADLKDRLGGDDAPDIYRLLRRLRDRKDLLVGMRDEIDDLLRRQPVPRQAAGPQQVAPPPNVQRPGAAQQRGSGRTTTMAVVGCVVGIVAVFVLIIGMVVCVNIAQRMSGSGTLRYCVIPSLNGYRCSGEGLLVGNSCYCREYGPNYPGYVE